MEEGDCTRLGSLPSVTDRYFTKYYALAVKNHAGEDLCILQHSNSTCESHEAAESFLFGGTDSKGELDLLLATFPFPSSPKKEKFYNFPFPVESKKGNIQLASLVCVVCLAPSHALLTTVGIEISQVEFQIGHIDRTKNQVSGKRKRGGQKLTPGSLLCFITCSNGDKHVVHSCIKGTLLEVNERLVDDPSLLISKPTSEGYVAIIMPKLEDAPTVCRGLLNEEQYKETLQSTQTATPPPAD